MKRVAIVFAVACAAFWIAAWIWACNGSQVPQITVSCQAKADAMRLVGQQAQQSCQQTEAAVAALAFDPECADAGNLARECP